MSDESKQELKAPPAVMDVGGLAEAAIWIASVLGSVVTPIILGVISNKVSAYLEALESRFGDEAMEELKILVIREIVRANREGVRVSDQELKSRIDKIWKEATE